MGKNDPAHVLYKTGDTDTPSTICDANGEVVLGLCRVCGAGEIELEDPCRPLLPKQIKHLKRGSTYDVIGEGEVQISVGHGCAAFDGTEVEHGRIIAEGARLVIYRAHEDGKYWLRFPDEINDPTRFEKLENESAPESTPAFDDRVQSDMATAPAAPVQFLAESVAGDWLIVERYDPHKPGDYSGNFVIHPRTGRWWDARRWRPLDPMSPALWRDR